MTSYVAAVRGQHERNGEFVEVLADGSAIACRRSVAGEVQVFLYPPPVVVDSSAPSWVTVTFTQDEQNIFLQTGDTVHLDPLQQGATVYERSNELFLNIFREGDALTLVCRYTVGRAVKSIALPFTPEQWGAFFEAFQTLTTS